VKSKWGREGLCVCEWCELYTRVASLRSVQSKYECGMTMSASIVWYEKETCDWTRTMMTQVAAHVVLGTWPETWGGWSVIL
jgi:hypothetical protein